MDLSRYKDNLITVAAGLVALAAGIYLLQTIWGTIGFFADVFLILVLSWLVSLLLKPPVEHLENWGLKRALAAILVYGLFWGLIVGFFVMAGPLLVNQLTVLVSALPEFFAGTPGVASSLEKLALEILGDALGFFSSLAGGVAYVLMMILISFYLVLDKGKIWTTLMKGVPKNLVEEVEFIRRALEDSFGNFFRVQVFFGLVSALATLLVLRFFGIDLAISAAALAGILTLIPVIGPVLALIPPFLAAAILSVNLAVLVTVVIFIGQQILFNFLGPKVIGKVFKIHPVLVILSFVLGFKLLGIWGAIFALPGVSVLVIVGREFAQGWRKS